MLTNQPMNLRKWHSYKRILFLPGAAFAIAVLITFGFFGCSFEERTGSHLIAPTEFGTDTLASTAPLTLTVLDVGQGDAFALGLAKQTTAGVTLIDAGPEDARWDTLTSAFGLISVQTLILTHPDADHAGGAVNLMNTLPVGKIYIASRPAFQAASAGRAVLALAKTKGIPIDTLRAGQSLFGSGGELHALWPPPDTSIAGNEGSLVLRWVSPEGEPAALFMGDAGIQVEDRLIRAGHDLQAPLLKVGHHGSRSASRAGFLFAVKPQFAVISCDSSVYGHPHPEVVMALQQTMPAGQIWRTDRQGSATLFWQPKTGWIAGWKSRAERP